jgi:hypothetical protein
LTLSGFRIDRDFEEVNTCRPSGLIPTASSCLHLAAFSRFLESLILDSSATENTVTLILVVPTKDAPNPDLDVEKEENPISQEQTVCHKAMF